MQGALLAGIGLLMLPGKRFRPLDLIASPD